MLSAECMIAVQVGGKQPVNPPAAEYIVIALVALVLGLIVVVFIRSSARRRSKGRG